MGVGWRGLRASGPAPFPGAGGRWGVGAGVAVHGVTPARAGTGLLFPSPFLRPGSPRSRMAVPPEQHASAPRTLRGVGVKKGRGGAPRGGEGDA